ncbi:MAG: transcriptional regulator [Gammaproteobacteria bacterium CG22_combo_CG10-13_8_21_14_all_40_8]|nr:MAG: transcriptional regulator [Gammaproteobacteria bacterium CG22_combo_CG10-13_8_21_14_all_40_8]
MSRRLPPLNSLRAFDSAARHLSFTRAADELFVTQAAVSHQIKSLEEFLGMKLFLRRNRTLLLTHEGQSYWPAIRKMFEQLGEATERLKMVGASGALTVSVIPTFAVTWLVPRLKKFSQLYPDIDVRLKSCEHLVDFGRDDVDVQIYFGMPSDYSDNLHVECLLDEYLVPVCSPELLNGPRPLNSPEDLRYHTLLHDESITIWKDWLDMAGVKGVNLNNGPIFSHSNLILQAARYGQGIAIGHSVLAQLDIQSGRLVRPFDLVLPSQYSYDILCPKAWADQPKITAFREWLKKMISDERERDAFSNVMQLPETDVKQD